MSGRGRGCPDQARLLTPAESNPSAFPPSRDPRTRRDCECQLRDTRTTARSRTTRLRHPAAGNNPAMGTAVLVLASMRPTRDAQTGMPSKRGHSRQSPAMPQDSVECHVLGGDVGPGCRQAAGPFLARIAATTKSCSSCSTIGAGFRTRALRSSCAFMFVDISMVLPVRSVRSVLSSGVLRLLRLLPLVACACCVFHSVVQLTWGLEPALYARRARLCLLS